MKDSGNSVQSFHQSYPSRCTVMEACVYMCVCVCVPLFHQSYPSQGSVSRPGQESWRVIRGAGLQLCTLTKHLFHKINASRLVWVPENPGRLAFAATHLIPITRQTRSEPAETIWMQTLLVCKTSVITQLWHPLA